MAHFARVINGIVTEIVVAEADFIESGAVGDPKEWVQTSYNTRGGVHYVPDTTQPSEDQTKALRKNYAIIGGAYSVELDAFIPIKPFPSWVLDEQTCLWEAPIPKPEDGHVYEWDEDAQQWNRLSYLSWSLNPATGMWEAPIPYPEDGYEYYWDEAAINWVRTQGQSE